MKSTFTKSITALILVIAMAVGMTASLGGKAQAATTIYITYNAGDDATINGKTFYTVPASSNVSTKITTVKPIRSGCNFLGWTTAKNSGRVDYKAGAPATFQKGIALWPVWNTNISYAAGNGATINGNQVANVSVTLGKATKVPTFAPVKPGYEFLGWSTIKDSGKVQYKPGASITYTKPMTRWPVWDTKCTILYLDTNANGDVQFKIDTPIFKNQLSTYLSKRVTKTSISVQPFSSFSEFEKKWNSMPDDQAVVIINCHGWPDSISFGFYYADVHKKLKPKNIKVIMLVACNCGHTEHYDNTNGKYFPENMAEAFAREYKCVVYASDGELKAETLESAGSNKPAGWKQYNAPTSTRTQNTGWLAYDCSSRDGLVRTYRLGIKDATTIGALLDIYYSQRYSW